MRAILISSTALLLVACAPAATTPVASAPIAEVAQTTPEAAAPPAEVKYGAAGTYKLDLSHASLTWRVSHFGLSKYTGRFKDFDATLQFNLDDAAATTLTATINPASVETDYPGDYAGTHPTSTFASWNEDLANNAQWFNAGAFNTITFTSTRINPTGPATGQVTGDLTFLGVTKPVTLDVAYNGVANFPWAPDVDKIGFSATGKINRSEFGMAAFLPNIGDEVELIIEAEFAQQVAP